MLRGLQQRDQYYMKCPTYKDLTDMATSVYYICNVGFFDIPLAQDDIFVFLAFDSDTYVFSA